MGTLQDLTDQEFGLWTVLRRAPSRHSPCGAVTSYWLCRCRCGVEKEVSRNNLRTAKPDTGCYDCYRARAGLILKPETRIGSWTVIEASASQNGRVWLCRCDCGVERRIPGKTLQYGTSTKCVACGHASKQRWQGKVPQWLLTNIERGALARDYVFEVTADYLNELFDGQDGRCALTGVELTFSVSRFKTRDTTASLDRIDNELGYVHGNVRWVHKVINRMRQCLTDEVFVYWCRQVAQHHESIPLAV